MATKLNDIIDYNYRVEYPRCVQYFLIQLGTDSNSPGFKLFCASVQMIYNEIMPSEHIEEWFYTRLSQKFSKKISYIKKTMRRTLRDIKSKICISTVKKVNGEHTSISKLVDNFLQSTNINMLQADVVDFVISVELYLQKHIHSEISESEGEAVPPMVLNNATD